MPARKILATLVAFLAGALAWVLPSHVLGKIVEHYPETTWSWLGDGINNGVLSVSLPLVFIIGFIYGFINPRYFWISFLATSWIVPFNIALDVSKYPTSHNLLPFEVGIFAVLNLITVVGAWLGRMVNLKYPQRNA